jgi:hypothetical protein
MAKTLNRQPYSVSTSSSNYPKQYSFVQAEFKGICDNSNDIVVNQQAFADAKNVYVNESGLLVSRAPFKFDGDEAFIVEEWSFDEYRLRLQCIEKKINDDDCFLFVLRCVSHTLSVTGDTDKFPYYTWRIPKSYLVTPNAVPKTMCFQVEDKVFIWFAGISFIAFNTNGPTPYFEDANKYLYLPILKQVVNGIESDLETENFLTDSHRVRYHHSIVSGINFSDMIDKDLRVSYTNANATNGSEYLYDMKVQSSLQSLSIIYPKGPIGADNIIDFVHTDRGDVYLRYDIITHAIALSYDGRLFANVPFLPDIIAQPCLTKDGYDIMAFTANGLAKYVIEDGVWYVETYAAMAPEQYHTRKLATTPNGYFARDDLFVYIYDEYLYLKYKDDYSFISLANYSISADMCGQLYIKDYIADEAVEGCTNDVVFVCIAGELLTRLWLFLGQSDGNMALMSTYFCDMFPVKHGYKISDICIHNIKAPLSTATYPLPTLTLKRVSYNYPNETYCEYTWVIDLSTGDRTFDFTSSDVYDKKLISPNDLPICASTDGVLVLTSQGVFNTGERVYSKHGTEIYKHTSRLDFPVLKQNELLTNGDKIQVGDLSGRICKVDEYALYLEKGPIKSGDNVTVLSYSVLADPQPCHTDIDYLLKGKRYVIEKVDGNKGDSIYDGDAIKLSPYDGSNTVSYGSDSHYYFPYGSTRVVVPLPTTSVNGTLTKIAQIIPKGISTNGVLLQTDGTLWTSHLDESTSLYLDEYINAKKDDGTLYVNNNLIVPDHVATMGEHYLAFNNIDNQNVLETTQTKRDIEDLYEGNNADFLLYLPKRNEQRFIGKITALHPLSDTQLGIFTAEAVWYVSKVTLDDATIAYTTATKSRIPLGCRNGDTVITALDGQAILFPTQRGITAMAPQDFIATTEKSLSYLSDTIQKLYFDFFKNDVLNIAQDIKPMIKSAIYKYWVLFYKYMDRQILLLDTRNATWWTITTPYPIKDVNTNTRLYLLLQIDAKDTSVGGVPYLFADLEEFDNLSYTDDIINDTWNGDYDVVKHKILNDRRVLHYAKSDIDWSIVSQKLHLNQPNNYKSIKGIYLNLQGTQSGEFSICTKAYRDMYNPTKEASIIVNTEEIGTFVYRLNVMHAAFFQYTLKRDTAQCQLRLNSLTIKYETKESIR